MAAPALAALAACTGAGDSSPETSPLPAQPPPIAAGTTAAPASDAPAKASPGAEQPPAQAAPPGMVAIPPGLFLMGSKQGEGGPEEHPMHEVILAGFYLDATEVTMDAYAACVAAEKCKPTRTEHPFCNNKFPDRGNHPVNCVDHADAEAYCAFVEKRLPNEREWEYAANGGSEQRRFSWGNEDPDATRSCYEHPGTCPVASFAPGAFGLYDVSGNVWEWTSTWFAPYPGVGVPAYPQGEAETGRHRVYRGGSWSRRFPKWLRNELRNRYKPNEWSASLGMRCARSQTPAVCPEDTELQAGSPQRPDACVRVRGTPQCEPGYGWNGRTCVVGGAGAVPVTFTGAGSGATAAGVPSRGSALPGGADGSAASPGAVSAATAPEASAAGPAQIGRARTPQHDGDCKSHWPKTPAAYRFSGGTFWSRNPVIASAGCTKRDMGESWTSACCAQ